MMRFVGMKAAMFFGLAVLLTGVGHAQQGVVSAQSSAGKNSQTVVVNGSVLNSASGGATARINIGSVVGTSVGSNSQTVVVNGSVVNSASGRGSKSEINIGSVTR